MTKIKKNSALYLENIRKLLFLNRHGVKVKIDGSWGSWLLKLYERIKSTNKNNVLSYILDIFNNIMIGAAVSNNPSVMTASGWKLDKEGNYILKRTKDSDLLADNLSVLSWASPTHPGTAIIDAAINKVIFPSINFTANKALETVAKAGNNYARSKIISRELNKLIKNFDGTVSENYFNSPYNWYRITESPEVYGIKEMGKNVTTRDAVDMYIPSNLFRLGVIDNNLTFRDGYWYKPLKRMINFSKRGSAHGNTSLAAKGHLWQGTTADSRKFPITVLEGDMPILTYRGFNPATGLDSRTSFHLVDSETIPMGARIGFHTGEMPIEGLRSFTRLSNGRYRYDGPVIPYKTILVNK